MYSSELTQDIIQSIYKGDKDAYLRDRKRSKAETIQWSDIALNALLYPELDITSKNVMHALLGFDPPECFTLPHESFIRSAIKQHLDGEISLDQLYADVEVHLKLVRNVIYDEHLNLYNSRIDYEKYYTYLPHLAEKAKERLTGFLGYVPALETSVCAEVFLRKTLNDPTFRFDDRLNSTDLQALTLIKLREVLLIEGKEAALHSPLPARDLISRHILKRTANEKTAKIFFSKVKIRFVKGLTAKPLTKSLCIFSTLIGH